MNETRTGQEEIIRLSGVSFRYPGAAQYTLNDVNLVIHKGDFVAVAGSNGSGKSTLCKCFNGLIPNYYTGDLDGEITVAGRLTSASTVAELSRKVGYVFQDFENQLVRPTVLDEACFAPLNYGFKDYKERGEHALELLGIEHLKQEWIWQLSGGQKHLAALAGVLSLDPDVIIMDEPAAQLDPAHAAMVYGRLKTLNEQQGKTIVVIEHHTEFIANYCSHMILLGEGGDVLWKKTVAEGLSQVEQLMTLNIQPPQVTQAVYTYEQGRRNSPQRAERDAGRMRRIYPVTLDEAARYWSSIANDRIGSRQAPGSHRDEPPARSVEHEPLISLQRVSSGYQDLNRTIKPVLNDLDLQFYEGERVAVVGNNGAGKSTLLRLLSGIRKPYEGEIAVCGMNAGKEPPERVAEQVAFIFQNPEEMFIEDSIRKDIEFFLKARGQQDRHSFIEDIVDRFRLQELQDRDGRLLSGGQQRRATLAIGLAMRPQVLLLDEPTASLDIMSRREMTMMLDQLHDRVKLVIVATHDMQLVADWASRVVVMHQGKVLMDADSRSVFQHREVLEKAALIPPQITQLSEKLRIKPTCLSVDEFVELAAYSGFIPKEA